MKIMENLSQKSYILIPTIKEKQLNFRSFVLEFHEFRKIWEPKSNEFLEVKLEPTNKMGKFAAEVIKNKKLLGILLLVKLGAFPKQFFYFLRCEYNDCKVKIVDGKAAETTFQSCS